MSSALIHDQDTGTDPKPEQDKPLTFLQMLGSTLAAAYGVQSSKNRHRDFTRGRALPFILMGIGFTAFFVLLMSGIVTLVLHQSG